MADILQTSIKLNDKMTATLKRIEGRVDNLISKMGKLEKSVSKAMNNVSKSTDKAALNEQRLARQTNLAKIAAEKLNQEKIKTNLLQRRNINSQNRFNRSINQGVGIASKLGNALRLALGGYLGYQGASKTIDLADTLQMTTNRLDLLNDGKQSTSELKNKIYESAMRSRADYLETANAVSMMGLRTGDVFKNMDELIAFNETLNKMFVISGTKAHEQWGSTIQLIQALSSGVLRGQELNSIMESAPAVAQAITKYMGISIKQLRDLAEEGKVTSDIVKNAMFKAAEETNEKFKKMKYTFGHIWTGIKNSAIKAFEPVLEHISNITSSPRWIKFIDSIGVAINNLAAWSIVAFDKLSDVVATCFDWIVQHGNAIKGVFNTIGTILSTVWGWVVNIADFIINNWSLVAPVIWGIVSAMLIFKTVSWAAGVISAIVAAINIVSWGWVVLAIIGVVIAFYWVIAAINDVCGTTYSATAIIFGIISWLAATIINLILIVYNVCAWFTDGVINFGVGIGEWLYNAFNNGFTGWIGAAKSAFWSFVSWVYGLLEPLVALWDKMKGTNYSSSIQGWLDKKTTADTTSNYKKFERYDSTVSLVNPNDWAKSGYNVGKTISNIGKNGKKIDFGQSLFPTDLGYTPIPTDLGYTPIPTNLGDTLTDPGKYASGGYGDNPALDKIAQNTSDIAKNTSVSKDEEDLSYMRDLATRQAINRYTLTDLKVEQNNNNNFANGVDANGMLDLLKRILHEGVQSTANGVHI